MLSKLGVPAARAMAVMASALVAACTFDGGGVAGETADADSTGDGFVPDGAPLDASCATVELGFRPANLIDCSIPAPTADLVVPAGTLRIDTGAGTVSGDGAL